MKFSPLLNYRHREYTQTRPNYHFLSSKLVQQGRRQWPGRAGLSQSNTPASVVPHQHSAYTSASGELTFRREPLSICLTSGHCNRPITECTDRSSFPQFYCWPGQNFSAPIAPPPQTTSFLLDGCTQISIHLASLALRHSSPAVLLRLADMGVQHAGDYRQHPGPNDGHGRVHRSSDRGVAP